MIVELRRGGGLVWRKDGLESDCGGSCIVFTTH